MGILQQNVEDEKPVGYDYVGVPYPEGFIDNRSMILFQHEDVENILYLGFTDIERQGFLAALAKEYEKLKRD